MQYSYNAGRADGEKPAIRVPVISLAMVVILGLVVTFIFWRIRRAIIKSAKDGTAEEKAAAEQKAKDAVGPMAAVASILGTAFLVWWGFSIFVRMSDRSGDPSVNDLRKNYKAARKSKQSTENEKQNAKAELEEALKQKNITEGFRVAFSQKPGNVLF